MSKKKNSSSIHKVLTQMVLDIFEQNGNTPLNYKQVSAKLNVRDPDARDIIFEILRDEVKAGTLKEAAPGKFQLLELKTFIEGKVDLTNDGSAFIVTDDEFESDI
ncbi:MAG: ribonuclease R, partial [Mucilaginibacter sp.]